MPHALWCLRPIGGICWPCLNQGKKDIVFRLIIEYSSLRDFYRPLGNNNRSSFFLMSIFEQWYFGLCWNLRLVTELLYYLEGFLVSFRGFFEDYIFAWWNYLSFHNSSFALRIFFNVKWQGHIVTHPLLVWCNCWPTLRFIHSSQFFDKFLPFHFISSTNSGHWHASGQALHFVKQKHLSYQYCPSTIFQNFIPMVWNLIWKHHVLTYSSPFFHPRLSNYEQPLFHKKFSGWLLWIPCRYVHMHHICGTKAASTFNILLVHFWYEFMKKHVFLKIELIVDTFLSSGVIAAF